MWVGGGPYAGWSTKYKETKHGRNRHKYPGPNNLIFVPRQEDYLGHGKTQKVGVRGVLEPMEIMV